VPTDLTLAELSALADVPVRTIRYYIAQGLLPAPGREGAATRYPLVALHRLRLVRQLQREHLPLAEIRRQLEQLSDAEIEALAGEAAVTPADSALEYVQRVLAGGPATAMRSPAAPPGAGRSPGRLGGPALQRADVLADLGPARAQPQAGAPAPLVAGSDDARPDDASGPPRSTPVPSPTTAAAPERSQWERIVLLPDVELHIRRPSSRITNRRVERLVTFARELLEEDRP
jgi:DNA-binding transcriptional MerR regulator